MTCDELEIFLEGTFAPALEVAWKREKASERTIAEQARAIEEERKAKEEERKARDKAEKENEALRKALEDERNKNKTHVRNKFGSSSRRSSFLSSHKGAESSCILRSLIVTCKLWKVSVCEYFNKIYTAFSVGRTDYESHLVSAGSSLLVLCRTCSDT